MQSANWVSAENGLCVVQTTEINEFGTGSNYRVMIVVSSFHPNRLLIL